MFMGINVVNHGNMDFLAKTDEDITGISWIRLIRSLMDPRYHKILCYDLSILNLNKTATCSVNE